MPAGEEWLMPVVDPFQQHMEQEEEKQINK
jgi:hypothetical protein